MTTIDQTTTDQTIIDQSSTDQTPTRATRAAVQLRRVMLSLLLAALAVVGLNLQGASAWTSPSADGSYGAVTPRGAQGGRVYFKEIGALYGSHVPAITVFGPIVGRSPATSGAQTVEFRYAIYQWQGGQWVTMFNSPAPYVQAIPAGYSSTAFAPIANRTLVGGYHRVTFSVTWRDAYGRYLGSRTFDNAHASDYSCAVAACTVGAGWVWI